MRDTPSAPADPTPTRGLTVADVARRYRVSADKVRRWIRRGELHAVNTAAAACTRPRFVVLPEALVKFEQRRAGCTTCEATAAETPACHCGLLSGLIYGR